MKISVISPIKHSGTTMVSLFLGQALAVTQGVNIMLTYSGMSRRICEYASVSALEDKTCSISQVVKLMEARAISPEDLFDYSLGVCTNLHIMDTADPTLTEEEQAFIDGMTATYPHVMKMQQPLTLQQYRELIQDHPTDKVIEVLVAMENYKQLTKNNRSAVLTIRNWIKRAGR